MGYITMDYITLGKSGIKASKLALGAWAIGGGTWWGDNDDKQSIEAIHEALANGINMIDTAPAYGFGHSERVVGEAIRSRRDKVVLSTKCGLHWDEAREGSPHAFRDGHAVKRNLRPESLQRDIEDSLLRLGTDYIDLYITHWQSAPEFPTPVRESMEKLMELKKQGKIRAIGASNVDEGIIREYLKYGQLDVIQERYTMLDRKTEGLFEVCRENGIAVMAYSPLEQGLFTGKYGRDYKIPELNVRQARLWFQPENLQRAWDMMDRWKPLCEKYACTMAQLAIAWTATQADFLQVICGARTVEQVRDITKGSEINLEAADIALMRTIAEATVPAGA